MNLKDLKGLFDTLRLPFGATEPRSKRSKVSVEGVTTGSVPGVTTHHTCR